MAKGNMFLGMSRGSVGDVTFYRNQGQQCARARNRAPRNPKTYAQIVQRMILATASKAYSRMRGITDHSFQGVQYGAQSQSYFLKKAMDRIRGFVANELANFPATSQDPFAWVGLARPDSVAESGFGLLISEGSIPTVTPVYKNVGTQEEPEYELSRFGSEITVSEGQSPSLADVLESFGASLGDQITIAAILDNGLFTVSRYCTSSDADDTQTWYSDAQEGIDSDILTDESKMGDVMLNYVSAEKGMVVQPLTVGRQVEAAAVIISRKVGSVWQRSTQYLMPAAAVQNVSGIVALWELSGSSIEAESPYYLNNADD